MACNDINLKKEQHTNRQKGCLMQEGWTLNKKNKSDLLPW